MTPQPLTYTWRISRLWYCPFRQGHFLKLQACFKGRDGGDPRVRSQIFFYKNRVVYSTPSWEATRLAFLTGTIEENFQAAALKVGLPSMYSLLRVVKESGDLDIPLSVEVQEPLRPTLFEHLESD